MPKPAKTINPSHGLYIKLGRGGSWEKECLKNGILRFGYKETPFDAAVAGDWETVWTAWHAMRHENAGTATRDVTQIRYFFERDDEALWTTFSEGTLWWCFAKPGVKMHKDGDGSYRETVDGWHNTDINGTKLTMDKLSGNLLRMQGFRGTICDVKAFEYLKQKLNGKLPVAVDEAAKAENHMIEKIVPLMRLLTWQDFELLVDLVFSNSGWRRVTQLGKTQKTVDFELIMPITNERAFVQIKSSANKKDLAHYLSSLKDSVIYDRMFFVWHTGEVGDVEVENVELIGPNEMARMVFEAGLTSWLREKVS